MGCPVDPAAAELTLAAQPEGAAIWLEGVVDDDAGVHIEVWAKELGSVLGYSMHLEFDPEHLEPAAENPIGGEQTLGDSGVVYVSRMKRGDATFGATLRSTTSPAVALDAAVLLGRVNLQWQKSGTSSLSVQRALARRVDGSLVTVTPAGATLKVVGGEL
jgi:hypothetical protein